MPNPKRRFSKTRTATRRSTKKAAVPTLSVDSATGATHLRHRAHWEGDKLFYKGHVVVDKTASE
ncbi:MAG: 50S ribosomal protein L32 [Flavobacteriales bacterium]|nr:50S ribosomal protein L32 [Flavobacteriales bacterium]MBL0129459.1 50S ribosomal protein L32 [Flavobacteriales bacterium]MCC6939175.1 50S ribosomal protein L32 [Flavobacteriales bacterium]